jgi:hypothetical protein
MRRWYSRGRTLKFRPGKSSKRRAIFYDSGTRDFLVQFWCTPFIPDLLSGPLRGLLNPSGREKSSTRPSSPEAPGGSFRARICGRGCRCRPSFTVLGERHFSRMPANRLLAQDLVLATDAYFGQPSILTTRNRFQAAVCFRAASILRNSSSHRCSFRESG